MKQTDLGSFFFGFALGSLFEEGFQGVEGFCKFAEKSFCTGLRDRVVLAKAIWMSGKGRFAPSTIQSCSRD